jgi:predicted NBD/HSP70 family sugar kinase
MTVDRVSSINMSRILHMIYKRGAVCRPDISKELGLDRSTVSKMISTLGEKNVIKLLDKGDSTLKGGRKPIYLDIDYNIGHVIGIEIQTDFWCGVILNLKGDIVKSYFERINKDLSLIAALEEVVFKLKESSMALISPLLGVVVSLPGIINPEKGIMYRSNPLDIHEPINLRKIIEPYFQVPILIENDANCCCWAELFNRRESIVQNFICVLVEFRRTRFGEIAHHGVGVGLGLVLNHQVHYGSNFSAGEFQSVFCNGPHSTQFSISDEDAQRILTDDSVLVRVFNEFAVNVSLLVNVFSLDELVVVGALGDRKELFDGILKEAIQTNWPYDTNATCKVKFTDLGHETVAYGAACMFIQKLFSIPNYDNSSVYCQSGFDLLNQVHPSFTI